MFFRAINISPCIYLQRIQRIKKVNSYLNKGLYNRMLNCELNKIYII